MLDPDHALSRRSARGGARHLGWWVALVCGACAGRTRPPDDALHAVVDREWAWRLHEFPLLASSVGVRDADDRLGRVDPATQRRHLEHWRAIATELAALPQARMTTADRVTAAVLAEEVHSRVAELEHRTYLMPINGDSGFYLDIAQLPRAHPWRTVVDYEHYLARLRDLPRYFDENLGLLRDGLAAGITVPQVVLTGRDAAARAHAEVRDPTRSAFYAPFAQLPGAIPAEAADRLRAEARSVIAQAVIPAYAKVARFLAETYIPGARKTIAASDLPDGAAFYRAAIRQHLTRDMTPEAVRDLGLREVARISAKMEAIRQEVGFQGELSAFLVHLRTAPQFYAPTAEALLMRAAWIAKRIDAQLPRWFGTLPRLTYGVEPVPDAIAPFSTGGRYVNARQGSGNAGTYWVNTYDLPSRPLYVLPALTLHEAVPGHHLQAAIAAEQTDLPVCRRHAYFDVTGEGWGLYAEKLGEDMGIYTTPYERFGRLTYEMWRACRLVVDTGIHAFGWSREQARAYMRDHTALSEHEIETEVDRYIAWPGQALAYKVGELAILELRARAERALGERFDIRRFHDAVLAGGSLPLGVLEDQIARYIADELARPGPTARPRRDHSAAP
ncbi:MAG TPA: DUF885 domain-containing protein [Kofleriaceae bacterium]|nr:DUF885 domain-containing protein [Kofleriaceae bacterium]